MLCRPDKGAYEPSMAFWKIQGGVSRGQWRPGAGRWPRLWPGPPSGLPPHPVHDGRGRDRERDRGVGIDGLEARVLRHDLAPGDRLLERRAREAAPVGRVGRELDREAEAAVLDPPRGLGRGG